MIKHIKLMTILVVGLVFMLASNASAASITVNGATAFDSGGFEGETAGLNPSSPTVGSYVLFEINDPPRISNVEVIDSIGGGPGANYGEQYLLLEKTANVPTASLGAIMLLNEPAVKNDVVVAEFAFYMDSTKTDIANVWDMLALFPFVHNDAGFFGRQHNWIGFGPQSEYYTTGAGSSGIDWTGAQPDDMYMSYYDGSWHQVMTAAGSPFFANFDQWHDIRLDLTVGQDYTITVDNVTSTVMPVDPSQTEGNVIGLQALVNGSNNATGFYIDSVVPEPGTIALLLSGLAGLLLWRRRKYAP